MICDFMLQIRCLVADIKKGITAWKSIYLREALLCSTVNDHTLTSVEFSLPTLYVCVCVCVCVCCAGIHIATFKMHCIITVVNGAHWPLHAVASTSHSLLLFSGI